MSRNGSGTYSVPNTFVSGTTITASGHNQNWSDLATEMTNSVAADGQTSMTGPLKASNGTAAAPSVSFASDADSGMYRIGANNIGVAVAGAKVLDVSSTGLDITGTINSSGAVKQNTFALLPIGTVFPYAGSSAPSGYVLCYGQAVSRSTYADLFAILSTTYGSGDGSTTFNLPDLRGRLVAGKDNMGGSTASRLTASSGLIGTILGNAAGAETITLTTTEMPSHGHTVNDPGHNHTYTKATALSNYDNAGPGTNANTGEGSGSTASNTTGITLSSTGGGGAHINVQPTIILNYIIFTGVA